MPLGRDTLQGHKVVTLRYNKRANWSCWCGLKGCEVCGSKTSVVLAIGPKSVLAKVKIPGKGSQPST